MPSVDATFYEWPGFLPGVAADGKVRVGVSASLPGEVDWRVSPANYAHLGEFLKYAVTNGPGAR